MSSTIDRVRVRMTHLMHPGRDRPAPVPHPASSDQNNQLAGATSAGMALSPLAGDVCALEQLIEDSEKLIHQAWGVAADLNQVRRQYGRHEDVTLLAEALGTFQGLLNRFRHNLRIATRSVNNLKTGLGATPVRE